MNHCFPCAAKDPSCNPKIPQQTRASYAVLSRRKFSARLLRRFPTLEAESSLSKCYPLIPYADLERTRGYITPLVSSVWTPTCSPELLP